MKKLLSFLLCLSLSLFLVGCGISNPGGMGRKAGVKEMKRTPLNEIAESNYQFGTTKLYLRGNFNGVDCWNSGYTSNEFEYVTGKSYEFCLKNIELHEGDLFKIAADSWDDFQYGADKLTNHTKSYYFGTAQSDNNIQCNKTGTYDIYCRYNHNYSNEYSVDISLSASYLLSMTRLNNFTRSTQINLTAEGYTDLVNNSSYFGEFYTQRTTLFIDNALYMHNSTNGVNSGYYTPKDTNEMWHYTIEGGYSNLNCDNTYVTNKRKDSSSVNTNDWYINGKYFAAHANEIATLMEYDYDNNNFYSDSNTLFHDFMFFTAPVFTNGKDFAGNDVVTFTGVGLKDLNGSIGYYLYANGYEYLSVGANTVFSQAILSNIGTTTIPVLNGIVENELD